MKIAILFSGRGSNLKNLIDWAADKPFLEVVCTVTDNCDAGGITYSIAANIPTIYIPVTSQLEWENSISTLLKNYEVDLVVLAGFMRVLHKDFCDTWEGKCINIHPSLLPAYPGLNTHQRVLDAGEEWTGCTVHWVTDVVDGGKIIYQEKVQVYPDDTAESLAERVLRKEHILYPKVIEKLARIQGL